jgi:hypothetical protein
MWHFGAILMILKGILNFDGNHLGALGFQPY